jgi:hypothetical protein
MSESQRSCKQHFIPPDDAVADLERKATDAEEKSVKEPEPRATELREEVKRYREWAASPAVGPVDFLSECLKKASGNQPSRKSIRSVQSGSGIGTKV